MKKKKAKQKDFRECVNFGYRVVGDRSSAAYPITQFNLGDTPLCVTEDSRIAGSGYQQLLLSYPSSLDYFLR